jgi:polysaccharide biosynthesis protein PslH
VRILVLAPQVPWPLTQGTAIRNFYVMRGLAKRHSVTLLAFGSPDESYEPLTSMGLEVVAVPAPRKRSNARRVAELMTTLEPDLARRLSCENMRATARLNALIGNPFDVIQVEGLEMAPYAWDLLRATPLQRRTRLVYDAHNAEWLLQRRAYENDLMHKIRWPAAAYSLIQTFKLRRYEGRLVRASWATIAVSKEDSKALQSLAPDARIEVAPNGVDTGFFQPLDPTVVEPQLCVFTGKMDFRPNVDAVKWFAESVWPAVRNALPGATFAVVGRDPAPAVRALGAHPGVTVTGPVQDVRPWLGRAGVVVAPLRVGGGTRLKVLEAMSMAKPIVATSMAVDGLNVEPGTEIVIDDDPLAMARSIVALAGDAERRAALGAAARRRAEFEYRWENVGWRIEALYRDG